MRALMLMACAGALAGCTTARPLSQQDELAYYVTTVDGLQGRRPLDPASVDFARLRLARRAVWSEADTRVAQPLAQALGAARATAQAEGVLAVAEQLLARDFTDAVAHLEKARALHDRNAAAASYHETLGLGLLRSMFASGDGRDGRHAIRVFSEREEEAALMFLDLAPVRRWAAPDAGRQIEAVECQDRKQRRRVLHFDRTPPLVNADLAAIPPPS